VSIRVNSWANIFKVRRFFVYNFIESKFCEIEKIYEPGRIFMRFGFIRFVLSLFLLSLLIFEPLAARAVDRAASKKVLSGEQRTRHILSRLTFGARPADFEKVRKIGVKAYLEEQLNPEAIDDSALGKRLEKLPTLNLSTPALAEQYNPPKPKPSPSPAASPDTLKPTPTPSPEMVKPAVAETPKSAATPAPKPTPPAKNPQAVVGELQRAKLLRAVYSERQLGEVLVDFWENHFSIYANKDATRWLMTSFDRDAVRPFAFGRFRDLLGATARSPAMLYYLDNWQSSVVRKYPATKDKPARQTGGVNENYARELLELHTLGVDGGYTQKDVQEVARCLTGWTIRKPNEEGLFMFNPQMHDNGEKTVLGQKIPPGGGIGDAEKVLDILAAHPSTARFIATKLARRFLGDDPPPAVINQAAEVFLKTDGSIRETLRSIITSPAFLSPAVYRAKIKSPFEFVVAALRVTAAETDAGNPVLTRIAKMGQPLFGRVTPDGYPEKSDEWLSGGSLLERLNFASALAQNQLKGTTINPGKLFGNADLSDPPAVSADLLKLVLQNEISPRSKAQFDKITENAMPAPNANNGAETRPPTPAADAKKAKPLDYVTELLTLALGSPEFQRR
jgi:uncharacterized protein (DUF1800 family)